MKGPELWFHVPHYIVDYLGLQGKKQTLMFDYRVHFFAQFHPS